MNPPRNRRILCVCNPRPGETSAYRLRAFERLGQTVIPFDITAWYPRTKVLAVLRDRYPAGPLIHRVNRDLLRAVQQHRPDVVWFDKPLHFTPSTVDAIKKTGAQTVCYLQDNPFGPRNDGCWYQFHKVFRHFDLHCLFRSADVARYTAWGLPWIQTMFSYEPSVHFPPPSEWDESRRSRGLSYVGSPHEDRPAFLRALAEQHHLPVVVSGPKWQKALSPETFAKLVSDGYLKDNQYREAIWRSKVNLSFVTELNEDDIAHKAVETAACQGFLLAKRTEGHQAIFEEDREAVFFSTLEECADKCRFYLGRPELRETIAARGRERAVRSGYDNDTQLALVLNRLDGAGSTAR